MTNEEQLDYLAGFFDADGSVSMHHNRVTKHMIRFSVWQSEPTVPYLYQELFGGSVFARKARDKDRHRNQWMWEKSCSQNSEFSLAMQDRLVIKSVQMGLAIKLNLIRNRQGCKLTQADMDNREEIAGMLKERNAGSGDNENIEVRALPIAYWAGLFDGDGAVNVSKSSGSRVYQPTVRIYSTYTPILDAAKMRFGGRVEPNYRGGRCKAWVSGNVAGGAFLRCIEPYLIEKKARVQRSLALIELISNGEKISVKRNKNAVLMFTDVVIRKMEALVNEIQGMNRLGPTRVYSGVA